MKLYDILEQHLKTEGNYKSDDGELLKWVVINKAQNYDEELIALLLQNEEVKRIFFVDVNGTLVFKQNLFLQFLEQKNYLNDSYTLYKNKVGLTIDGKFLNQRNEVALVWPFKDCILEGGQSREEQKREEIFFNEILAQDEITQLLEPKVLTNAKLYDAEGEKTFEKFNRNAELNKKRGLPENTITDNLIIKGNNLLALHTLKKEFAGKVKLIYIDPPYNTGNDGFKYNDNFNHSTWLTFMKNRLEVAKQLLREDGVIFVQCDDNEQAYLKVLMDEVFGRENFVSNSIAIINRGGRDYGGIAKTHEYLLVFSKSLEYELNGIVENDKKFPMYDEIGGFDPRELRNRNILFNKENRRNLYYPFYLNENSIDINGLYELSLEKKEGWIDVLPLKSQGVDTVWRWGKDKVLENINKDIKGKKKADGGFMIIQKYRSLTKMQRSIFDDKEFVNERGTEHIKQGFLQRNISLKVRGNYRQFFCY
jgi:adenine-specific DNA-methyltransferase